MSPEMPPAAQEHDHDDQAVVSKAEEIVAAEAAVISANPDEEIKPQVGETMDQFTARKDQIIRERQAQTTSSTELSEDKEVKDQRLTSDEQATIGKLDSSIMNPDRLTHLRTIFQGDMKRGRTEADAMASVSSSLTNTGGIAEYLPTKSTSDKYNTEADTVFQAAEKALRLDDKDFKDYVDALKSSDERNAYIKDFAQFDQKVYSNGAKHIYATDENGKKVHLSHDAILAAYGHSASEAKEARKAQPTETKESEQNGVYGYQGKDLVNHGIDIVGRNTPVNNVSTGDTDANMYSPVQPGMEIELAPSNELVPLEKRSDLPVLQEDESDRLPVPFTGTSNEIEVSEAAAESEPDANLPARLRNRWNDLMSRAGMLLQGDVRGALGGREKLLNKKRMIGAAAVIGAGILFLANNKYNWGIDVNPLDGDGLDLNPLNNNDSGSIVSGEAGPAKTPETSLPLTPDAGPQGLESVPVHIDAGEGTSHIARDRLGIKFDTVEQWNKFNDATNPLFEGVDGMYRDAASGELRVSKPGNLQVPQSILDEMQRVATEIKSGS